MVIYCSNRIIAGQVKLADGFFARFKGLMGKKHLNKDEGLLLTPCSSIHCFFMKTAIDAVYLSQGMTVLFIETLSPWKLGSYVKGTAHVLELAPGTASVGVGETLDIRAENKNLMSLGGIRYE